MAGEHLSGNYRVRALRAAFGDTARLCKKLGDAMEIRRHVLKLRYWPEHHPENESGLILDLDWEWVRSLHGLRVGELRIDDVIGGNDNLRAIFFVGDPAVKKPLPIIWVLRLMQKKRQDFSRNDLRIFKARRLLVIERFYKV